VPALPPAILRPGAAALLLVRVGHLRSVGELGALLEPLGADRPIHRSERASSISES